jgi:hypothetical protein
MKNTIKEIDLGQFYGTENFYHGIIKDSVYTDGVKHFISPKEGNCYWLYDIIQFSVFLKLKSLNVPDTYYFTLKIKDTKAEVVLEDYQGEVLYKQSIPFTDSPTGEIKLICGWDGEKLITCLTSEN